LYATAKIKKGCNLCNPLIINCDLVRIIFNDPFRIGLTQIPPHAVGVLGLFYFFAFESKLSTLINKKAWPFHGRAL
jgi:hypothetical protein